MSFTFGHFEKLALAFFYSLKSRTFGLLNVEELALLLRC